MPSDLCYPAQTKELMQILEEDQAEYKAVASLYWENKESGTQYKVRQTELTEHFRKRAKRALEILDQIKEPSLSNIGAEAAQALSIIASHASSRRILVKVLAAFNDYYKRNKEDTYYQAIPSMTDWLLIADRRPQRFGTIWLFDKNKQPFLPTVEDFEHINERRAEYGIEPLRWPKSLAIDESHQSWIKRPLEELIMREPTYEEYAEIMKDFIE
jgi:hypothetical protein